MRATPTSFTFVLLMSLLGALSAFATDMALAATEPMARELGVSAGGIGLALSAFMISFAVSPLVYGPLSDRYGRRPVALFACCVYMIGGFGCIFSHSLPALLAWRFVQGIGGGARPLALAIIGDHFKGAAAREKMSYVSALSLLAPLLAPTIGALLLGLGSWRLIYVFLTVTGTLALSLLWLRLDESLPIERRSAMSPRAVAGHYLSVFRNRRSLAFTVVAIAMFGVIFGYVSGSPLVMIGAFKLTPAQYGLTFALNSFGLLVGNLVNARLNAAGVRPAALLMTGLLLVCLNTLALLAITWFGNAGIAAFLPFLFLAMMGCAIANTNALQLAIEPLLHIAGTASAAVVSAQLGFGALAGFLVADLYDGRSALSTVAVMAGFGVIGLAAFLLRPALVPQGSRPAPDRQTV
ncbi:multidrug effflux MFS transporter [Beijerinckia sp. L45]|uniref:multidrug effflux MFS transporter n=1 Tax=Beijerinckia sp. L45 TaxID=1641855 RepID=UPI00131C9306|nr:multidrug effflux MFS transporter [Beijerinckia sp. L45]